MQVKKKKRGGRFGKRGGPGEKLNTCCRSGKGGSKKILVGKVYSYTNARGEREGTKH